MNKKRTAKRKAASVRGVDDTVREREITTTMNEMVDTVERYFSLLPWEWIYGEDGGVGYPVFKRIPDSHQFNRFNRWAERWMLSLYPEAIEFHRQIDLIPDNKQHDAAGEMAFTAEHFGFVCGVLVGCKMQGATRDDLVRHAQSFVESIRPSQIEEEAKEQPEEAV